MLQILIDSTGCLSGQVLAAADSVSEINYCSFGPWISLGKKRINISTISIPTNSASTKC